MLTQLTQFIQFTKYPCYTSLFRSLKGVTEQIGHPLLLFDILRRIELQKSLRGLVKLRRLVKLRKALVIGVRLLKLEAGTV